MRCQHVTNYKGHDHTGQTYTGHNYIGYNYIGCAASTCFDLLLLVSVHCVMFHVQSYGSSSCTHTAENSNDQWYRLIIMSIHMSICT